MTPFIENTLEWRPDFEVSDLNNQIFIFLDFGFGIFIPAYGPPWCGLQVKIIETSQYA